MKAIVISRFGGPDVLAFQDVPDPQPPQRGQIGVRVHATAVNRADLLQRRGRYPAPPGEPQDIPGLEFAGEVERCGPAAEAFRPGDRVMGLVGGGSYAEQVVLAQDLCLPVPAALSWSEAAAVPEAWATAFDALHRIGRIRPGEVVLIHAAASGVGIAAAQLARVAGARVIGLSRSVERRAALTALGLHAVLDATAQGLAQAIRQAAGDAGVDLVLDLVGAPAWELNLEVLAERGRLILIGLLGGATVEADLGRILHKRLSITGTVLRPRGLEERIELTRELAHGLLPLLAQGAVRPIVGATFPLSEARKAHAHVEANLGFGKTVLTADAAENR
jgi:NADPH:quinone reductase